MANSRSFIMPSGVPFSEDAPTKTSRLQKIDSKVEEEEEDGFKEVAISLLINEGADEEDLDAKPPPHDTDGGGGGRALHRRDASRDSIAALE